MATDCRHVPIPDDIPLQPIDGDWCSEPPIPSCTVLENNDFEEAYRNLYGNKKGDDLLWGRGDASPIDSIAEEEKRQSCQDYG